MHFHRFMRRVHDALGRYSGQANPLLSIADEIAGAGDVLCFDEFFVSDIGDAMILGEVMTALFRRGVTLVATSNVEPANLYENGLQRSRFCQLLMKSIGTARCTISTPVKIFGCGRYSMPSSIIFP